MTHHLVSVMRFGKFTLFGVAMLLFMYFQTIERYEQKHVVNEGIAWADMHAAGEITPTFHLRQSIRTEFTDLQPTEFHHPLCLDIQLANYANRVNTGRFKVRVSTASTTEERVLEAKYIRDNAMELVCFDGISFQQIHQKDAWVDVQGIDSPAGKSVTAVVSSTAGPPRATLNGAASDLTLVYIASIRKDPEWHQVNSYVLIVFAALLMTALLLGGRALSGSSSVSPK